MFTPILRLLFLLLFLIFPGGANTVLHAEETPDMDDCSLYIESKTDVASAQCMIDGGNQEDDKKRTDVGIGEEVELDRDREAVKRGGFGFHRMDHGTG